MPEKKGRGWIAFGISVLIAIVISIFSIYSGGTFANPETFGLGKNETRASSFGKIVLEQEEPYLTKTYGDLENIFVKLMDCYNNKDFEELSKIDFRYKNNRTTNEAKKYEKSIANYSDFELHKVLVQTVAKKSINGFIVYSYRDSNNEQKYALSEFVVKSINGNLGISYLNAKLVKYEDISKYLVESND